MATVAMTSSELVVEVVLGNDTDVSGTLFPPEVHMVQDVMDSVVNQSSTIEIMNETSTSFEPTFSSSPSTSLFPTSSSLITDSTSSVGNMNDSTDGMVVIVVEQQHFLFLPSSFGHKERLVVISYGFVTLVLAMILTSMMITARIVRPKKALESCQPSRGPSADNL